MLSAKSFTTATNVQSWTVLQKASHVSLGPKTTNLSIHLVDSTTVSKCLVKLQTRETTAQFELVLSKETSFYKFLLLCFLVGTLYLSDLSITMLYCHVIEAAPASFSCHLATSPFISIISSPGSQSRGSLWLRRSFLITSNLPQVQFLFFLKTLKVYLSLTTLKKLWK